MSGSNASTIRRPELFLVTALGRRIMKMKSNGTLTLVQSIYDQVHLALWATLVAFVAYFLAFIAPKLPEAAARAEALRIQEITQENEGYCAKWQMGFGTKMHGQCISDLQELRSKIQARLADQFDF
jgi:hypothetical protein